jgi:hypothetical protein
VRQAGTREHQLAPAEPTRRNCCLELCGLSAVKGSGYMHVRRFVEGIERSCWDSEENLVHHRYLTRQAVKDVPHNVQAASDGCATSSLANRFRIPPMGVNFRSDCTHVSKIRPCLGHHRLDCSVSSPDHGDRDGPVYVAGQFASVYSYHHSGGVM